MDKLTMLAVAHRHPRRATQWLKTTISSGLFLECVTCALSYVDHPARPADAQEVLNATVWAHPRYAKHAGATCRTCAEAMTYEPID